MNCLQLGEDQGKGTLRDAYHKEHECHQRARLNMSREHGLSCVAILLHRWENLHETLLSVRPVASLGLLQYSLVSKVNLYSSLYNKDIARQFISRSVAVGIVLYNLICNKFERQIARNIAGETNGQFLTYYVSTKCRKYTL